MDITPANLHRLIPLALLVIAVGALGNAYAAQYIFDLEPCILCLYQRIPYAVIGLLGVFGFLAPAGRYTQLIAGLAGLTFLAGAAIAFYHVGVEQHWWASAASCGGGDPGQTVSMDQFQALLQKKPEKACDEIDWTLFGISMATYNALLSTALAALSLAAVRRLRKG